MIPKRKRPFDKVFGKYGAPNNEISKQRFIKALEIEESKFIGRKPCDVKSTSESNIIMTNKDIVIKGYYESGENNIYIDFTFSFISVLETYYHEMRHLIQFHFISKYQFKDNQNIYRELIELDLNMSAYLNSEQYPYRLSEIDANTFAYNQLRDINQKGISWGLKSYLPEMYNRLLKNAHKDIIIKTAKFIVESAYEIKEIDLNKYKYLMTELTNKDLFNKFKKIREVRDLR